MKEQVRTADVTDVWKQCAPTSIRAGWLLGQWKLQRQRVRASGQNIADDTGLTTVGFCNDRCFPGISTTLVRDPDPSSSRARGLSHHIEI
jgi:hypothetical protein